MPLLPLLLLFLTSLIAGPAVAQDTRGVGRIQTAKTIENAPTGKSYALVIGINEYDDEKLTDLTGARRDAETVSQVLTEQGFEVIQLLDERAHLKAIQETIGNDLAGQLKPEDRLLVYFAGHGITLTKPNGGEEGFLVPANGDKDERKTMLAMRDLVEESFDWMAAKQVLYLADACHSGLAKKSGADNDGLIRVIMTAGTAGQEVVDNYKGHGLYTYFFLDGIRGAADYNGDGLVTTTELQAHLQGKVKDHAGDQQSPQIRTDDDGDFVFQVERSPHKVGDAPVNQSPRTEIKYFADFVWKNGAMEGIIPLTESQIQRRASHYRFEFNPDGKVQTVSHRNSANQPVMHNSWIFVPELWNFWEETKLKSMLDLTASQWVHRYRNGGAGAIAEVTLLDFRQQFILKLEYPRYDPARFNLRNQSDLQIHQWTFQILGSTEDIDIAKGVYGQGFKTNRSGFVEQRWNLNHDTRQQIRLPEDGIWGWGYEPNEIGQVLGTWPLDVNGAPTTTRQGVQEIRYRYNRYNLITEVSWWGPGNRPIVNQRGYSKGELQYDENHQLHQISFWGPDGQRATDRSSKQCAGLNLERDSRGNIISSTCLDLNGQSQDMNQGSMVYDANGYPQEFRIVKPNGNIETGVLSFDDQKRLVEFTQRVHHQNGQPIAHRSRKITFEYTQQTVAGNIERTIRQTEYDGDGSVKRIWESTFDHRGHQIEAYHFNPDEEPYDGPHSRQLRQFDAVGNMLVERNVNEHGNPVLRYGYAEVHYRYGTNRVEEPTEEAYFGTDGEPILSDMGYARATYKFDDRGNKTSETWYDTEGNIIPQTSAE